VHTTNDEYYENEKEIKEREDIVFTWFVNLPTSTGVSAAIFNNLSVLGYNTTYIVNHASPPKKP
jgi:1-aminocyclopropane-1-carboxylate deaminase/D-cysteine desulfhydrase-like pyridoxal-dependent ACC family enzyme